MAGVLRDSQSFSSFVRRMGTSNLSFLFGRSLEPCSSRVGGDDPRFVQCPNCRSHTPSRLRFGSRCPAACEPFVRHHRYVLHEPVPLSPPTTTLLFFPHSVHRRVRWVLAPPNRLVLLGRRECPSGPDPNGLPAFSPPCVLLSSFSIPCILIVQLVPGSPHHRLTRSLSYTPNSWFDEGAD